MPPPAVVMNMFYTGLGIARSLGEHGIPVIGLSAHRGIYGNFTRYAKIVSCPDSRREPEALRDFMLAFGKQLGERAVVFPTRDDDLVFLDRFRRELSQYFRLVIPESSVLNACLNKWETYLWAQRTGVPVPRCWLVEGPQDLRRIMEELSYPCVLKAVAAHQWRQGDNWRIVGARKAIGIASGEELLLEYAVIAQAGKQVLIQEMIPGGDESLLISACYLDTAARFVADFNTRKLVQSPEIFGTGCIVQAANSPELSEVTARLLESMRFTGIAEVEYKWSAAEGQYKLIEINPRPWDQHRLGKTCGVDLAYLAYCDHAGLPRPEFRKQPSEWKWIAEDTFVTTALALVWRRDPSIRRLFRLASGKRIYAIWSAKDPLPFLTYFALLYVPRVFTSALRVLWLAFQSKFAGRKDHTPESDAISPKSLEKGKSHV